MTRKSLDQQREKTKFGREYTVFPLTTRITSRLQKLFDKQDEFLLDALDETIEKVFNVCKLQLEKHPEDHEKIFEEICIFLNQMFEQLKVKVLYNTHPNFPLKWYKESSLGEQFLSNIVDKEEKLLERTEINGGTCYYWTIFLKQLFDRLKEIGIPLNTSIFVFNEPLGHAGLLIDYQGKKYLADMSGYNKPLGKTIIALNDKHLPYEEEVKTIIPFLLDQNPLGKRIAYFKEIKPFVDFLEKMKIPSLGISLNTKDYMNEKQNVQIKLSFTPKQLVFQKDKKIQYLPYPQEFPFHKYSEEKILDALITSLDCEEELKAELSHYLNGIQEKINLQKVYELLSSKQS
ncbi:MAG: hypothetical protein DLD55_01620 [candidate division SR1 bacterium]|nr:MAG: hypothetical protein DLD55_01620 [candidate division SR1 bacterium]